MLRPALFPALAVRRLAVASCSSYAMAPTPAAAPAWPAGERGTTLLHVEVSASIDKLFGDLFGVESELQARGVIVAGFLLVYQMRVTGIPKQS